MANFLVSGLINLETTLRVERFPLEYFPVAYPFLGVHSTVSGVGFNVAKALKMLGSPVRLLSLAGADAPGRLAREALAEAGLSPEGVLDLAAETPQSVILYEPGGRRQIHVDLKDVQDRSYPEEIFQAALAECSLAVLCNINFSRPMLAAARQAGKPVATDVHAIASLDDEYNCDFMAAADILFLSDERLPTSPEEWVRQVWGRFGAEIVVVGLGAQGALLGVRSAGWIERLPAVFTRPVVNTIGAGDALFSSFLHFYKQSGDPHLALRKAMVFASYKIGAAGAADGFLTENEFETLFE